MLTIIDSLIVEHFVFETMFDRVERLLPKLATLNEVKLLGGLVESLLEAHGDREENLAYVALDHLLADCGQVDCLYQDHKEIDSRLRALQAARTLPEARRLLKEAILASRKHFQREERQIFPEFKKAFQAETLAELGKAWLNRDAVLTKSNETSGCVLLEQ